MSSTLFLVILVTNVLQPAAKNEPRPLGTLPKSLTLSGRDRHVSLLSEPNYEKIRAGKHFPTPMMTDAEEAFLRQILSKTVNWFEYGAGGSTVFALSIPNVKHIHTVDSGPEWIKTLQERKDIHEAERSGRLKLELANIGKTKALGYPDYSDNRLWVRAARRTYALRAPEAHEAHWDTIFVDGRYRVSCFLNAVNIADDKTRIVFHDFPAAGRLAKKDAKRYSYLNVLKYADIEDQVDELAIFRVKPEVVAKQPGIMRELAADIKKFQDKTL